MKLFELIAKAETAFILDICWTAGQLFCTLKWSGAWGLGQCFWVNWCCVTFLLNLSLYARNHIFCQILQQKFQRYIRCKNLQDSFQACLVLNESQRAE